MAARRIGRLAVLLGVACLAVTVRWLTSRAIALPELGSLPAFQLADERGARLGRDALLGRVTIVDFIFTSCATACPILSAEMARLQDHVRARGLTDRVRLLSISVDPERDTPERLRAFAARWGADPALWRFARGQEAELRRVVVDGMKQVMDRQLDRGELDGFTILHGTRMILVDDEARMRGFYDASDAADRARLRHELEALAEGRVTPPR